MDNLAKRLEGQFGATLSDHFVKKASYNHSMDCLEYVSVNDITVSDRIDDFLTLIKSYDQSEVVGFKLKGFRYIFKEIIQPICQLDDEDFNPLIDVMKNLFTRVGDDAFVDKEKRTSAYRLAIEITKRDCVNLPDNLNIAA